MESSDNGLQNARVFVGNLPWSVDNDELSDHMAQGGEVVSALVIRDSSGRSRGGGIVEYASMEDAQNAIDTLNDTDLGGRLLLVREDREENVPQEKGGGGGGQNCRVYVGNLAWEVSWQDLKDHMRDQGYEVTRVDVMMESDGRSKGCAVVEFGSPEDAQSAIDNLNDTELMGRQIFVREDRETKRRGTGTVPGRGAKVFVGNLPEDITWQDLKDHMRQAGNVMHVEIPENEDGEPKGFAIVEFDNDRTASRAIREMNNTFIKSQQIHVREDRDSRRGGRGRRGRGRGRR